MIISGLLTACVCVFPVHNFLDHEGKRSLLILDEVWSPKIVEHFLIAGHKGKLLVTSGCGASGRFFSDEDIKKQCVGSHGASSCVLFHVGLDDYRSKQMDQRILKSISLTKIDAQVKVIGAPYNS